LFTSVKRIFQSEGSVEIFEVVVVKEPGVTPGVTPELLHLY
jgi:hypothetical protein